MSKKKEGAAAAEMNLFGVRILEKVYVRIQGILNEKVYEFVTLWAGRIGHWALVAAAGLGFLFALIYTIRINKFDSFLIGIVWVLLVFVVQFTAQRFLGAGRTLIRNNPSRLASRAFLECVAFLVAILGVVALIVSIVIAVRTGSLIPFLGGLGAFILLEFLAMATFHPQTITMEIVKESSAGQEALGIITYFLKALICLVPVVFGVGVLIFTVLILIDGIGLFGSDLKAMMSWASIQLHAPQVLVFAILPFASYIFFAFSYLIVDLYRAILVVPEKLDKLAK